MGILIAFALGGAVGYAFANGSRHIAEGSHAFAVWDFLLAIFFAVAATAKVLSA